MKKLSRLSVVVAMAVLSLTFVGTGPAAATSMAQLRAEALSIHQMPAGWTARQPTEDLRMGCLSHLLEQKGVKETHFEEVYFLGVGSLPLLVETMTTYSNVKTAFKKIAASIAGCHQVAGVLKSYPVSGTVRPLRTPHYGNSSVVYVITLAGKHITVKSDYAIVRKGNVIVALLEGNYPAVNLVQFESFLTKAVARVR
jgi:hypothetical protein